MSFYQAKKALEDNSKYIKLAADPAMYNINSALLNLTKSLTAMDAKIDQLQASLVHVSKQIAHIK
ncbi:MAG: hypothetical protein AB7G15_17695 [Alphaproteobacteria bacterium]